MRAIRFLAALLLPMSLLLGGELVERKWTVDGVERTALVHLPETESAPLVLVFHGHGGGSVQVARSFRIHELWPESVVVYPQGLKTPGKLTDPEGRKPGWQQGLGDQADRDLRFVDAILASLDEERHIDRARIYATGHSNGGGFTYLLWAARPGLLAAAAPSASVHKRTGPALRPLPVLHIAGRNDELVKFSWQERMIDHLLRLNSCGPAAAPGPDGIVVHPSKTGTPVHTYLHDAGHRFPTEAPARIVAFLKAQPVRDS